MLELIKIIALLPLILILIYITLKYGGKYMGKFTNGRVIKVYERVPLGQNVFICLVTIGGKPYIVSSGERGVEILLQLEEEVMAQYEASSNSGQDVLSLYLTRCRDKVKGKVKDEKS